MKLSFFVGATVVALAVNSAPACASRPSRLRSAPESFRFLYEKGWGTKLDTYKATLTKDLITLPDTTVRCVLSQADVDSVYHKMREIHFFDLPEPHPPWPANCPGNMHPRTTIGIEATLGSNTRRLSWSSAVSICQRKATGAWQDLRELEALIRRIMIRQPEYQELPSAQGGYK